ncbi:MAG: hypothetical protein ABI772_11955, partial [Bacteroidota bacterium]
MKKYLLFFVFVLTAACCNAQSGYQKFYYPNGKVSSEGTFVDGKPDGYWKAYYETGIIKSEGNRKNTVLNDGWKFYNDKGILVSEHNYVNGVRKGIQREYYNNGNISAETWLNNGVIDSVAKYYDEQGILNKTITYKEGVENGLTKEYADDGRIITIITFKNGFYQKEEKINRIDKFGFKQGTWKSFYADDMIKSDGVFKDDKKNGMFREYTPDGLILKIELYKNDILLTDDAINLKLDIKRDYYNNGRPKSSVTLINGVKSGVYRDYDREGKVTSSKLYDKDVVIAEGGTVDGSGLQQGNWKYFYPDGKMKSEGLYKDGKRDGPWTFYYP